ncbi:MAG: hypothetical protein Q8Q59_00070 [Luteolibacter sp.]|jgi:hypothetical protein|nr:hypothetical protein [Luteolibacter sp.]
MACLAPALAGVVFALEDPGRAKISMVTVTVYLATDGDPKAAGEKALPVGKQLAERLNREQRLRFKHYRLLGQDTQPVLRSYESWAQPLKPSDEVLVRFEAQGQPTKQSALLDLELWLGRKKIVKTDARLEGDKPLFMLGPEWRGGRLIISVALAPLPESRS